MKAISKFRAKNLDFCIALHLWQLEVSSELFVVDMKTKSIPVLPPNPRASVSPYTVYVIPKSFRKNKFKVIIIAEYSVFKSTDFVKVLSF